MMTSGVDGQSAISCIDVAEALGYQNTNDAVNTHCEEGVAKCYPIEDSMGRIQQVRVIDESDMYSP